jgi:CheY-like chemotaxis protein
VFGNGKRCRPRVEAVDLVTIDGDGLGKMALFNTLALASGRVRPRARDARHGAEPAQRRAAAPRRQDARREGRLILVAEDNEINRLVILHQLKLIGLAADISINGRQALERWRSGAGDIALLLTDLHMPEMDGYALARAIRAEEPAGQRLPIIAVTANALRDEELRCRAAGMDGYLTKPIQRLQLQAAIEEWLGPWLPAEGRDQCETSGRGRDP